MLEHCPAWIIDILFIQIKKKYLDNKIIINHSYNNYQFYSIYSLISGLFLCSNTLIVWQRNNSRSGSKQKEDITQVKGNWAFYRTLQSEEYSYRGQRCQYDECRPHTNLNGMYDEDIE